MCGIVGYVGKQQAAPILLGGCGGWSIAVMTAPGSRLRDHKIETRKKRGKIDEGLARAVECSPFEGSIGLGHTRWATHGPPSDENSHPHYDQSGRIAVVHNGVIRNYEQIREKLKGHKFYSATDTEVLAHLIGVHYER